jgi:CubicO group peptidase (beta-lactamase class C family)
MSERGFTKLGLERLRAVMRGHVDDGSHPGLVWMVARPGHVHVDTVGVDTLGEDRPMRRDTIFRISSMTKPITAVATMLLVEECRIRLDDPVDDLLPELADRRVLRTPGSEVDDTVPAQRPISVRDLLTFRAGYGMILAEPGSLPILRELDRRGMGAGPPQPGAELDADGWIAQFADLPLFHQPGEAWLYHTGADLLGVLIARASGMPFPRFLRERIFEPLGMSDTGFHVPEADLDRFSTAYFRNPATGAVEVFDPRLDGQWSRPPAFPGGGAGLVSTVDDFHAFSVMLASNGVYRGERLLSRASAEVMMTDQLTDEQKSGPSMVPGFWDSNGWGFGMSVVTRRVGVDTNPGRVGWDGGLGTAWSADRGETIITILMTQKAWDSPVPPAAVRDFRTAAYAAMDE